MIVVPDSWVVGGSPSPGPLEDCLLHIAIGHGINSIAICDEASQCSFLAELT